MPFDWKARIKNQNQLICRTTGVHDFSQSYTLDKEDVLKGGKELLFWFASYYLASFTCAVMSFRRTITRAGAKEKRFWPSRIPGWDWFWGRNGAVSLQCQSYRTVWWRVCGVFFTWNLYVLSTGWCIYQVVDILDTTICRDLFYGWYIYIYIKWCRCPYIMADHTAISFCMCFSPVFGSN